MFEWKEWNYRMSTTFSNRASSNSFLFLKNITTKTQHLFQLFVYCYMKTRQSIPYGLKNEQLLHIDQVAQGLKCSCVCPFCRQPLVAKKGQLKQHHFAHHRGANCAHALESVLHLRAKEIFAQFQYLVLPAVTIQGRDQPLYGPRCIQIHRVYLENYLDGIIPDIILETGHKRLLVEIKVSHGIGRKKINHLQKLGLAAIEIDALAIFNTLSGLNKQWNDTAFRETLLEGTQHKSWLYNPRKQWLEYNLRKQATVKKISHRQYKNTHHHWVQPCPQKKRLRRFGNQRSQSFADAIQDCAHCPYCIEIEYHKNWVGYREVTLGPKLVYCYGHLEE